MLETVFWVVIVAAAIEAAALAAIPRLWPWLRWSTIPGLGALIAGGFYPIELMGAVSFWLDLWLSMFLGAALAATVSMGAIFTYDFWVGPSLASLQRSGKRSIYLQGGFMADTDTQPRHRITPAPGAQAAPRRARVRVSRLGPQPLDRV